MFLSKLFFLFATMKKGKLLQFALIGGGIWAGRKLFRATQAAEALQVQFNPKKVFINSSYHLIIELETKITNPSPGSITVKSIGGNVNYKGDELGTFSYLNPIDIAPASAQTITVNIDIPLLSGLGALIQAYKTRTRNIVVESVFYTSVGNYPYSELITF